jgi:hypothetical protein
MPTELVVEVMVPLVIHWACANVERLKNSDKEKMSFFMI